MNPFIFFWLLFKASLFSTGGMGNLPSIHHDLLARGWATERQFAESLAVGQVAPGPTGLWVVSLGYFVDGMRGALLALLAICLPPFLVLAVDRMYRRMKDHPAIEGFVAGLGLAVVGVSVVVLVGLLRSVGADIASVLITLASLALGRRLPVVVVLVLAGLAGIVLR